MSSKTEAKVLLAAVAVLFVAFGLRKSPLKSGPLLGFICVMMTLGFSAFYEFFEWWIAVATGTAATAFLGTQGDVWDTQWDMFLATAGAIVSLWIFSLRHDRFLLKLSNKIQRISTT